MNTIKDILPELYREFFPSALLKLKIEEQKATCSNCLRSRDARYGHLYKNNLKCCTFSPFLPNYAVGGILTENLAGAEIIKQQISAREMTLPLGLFPSPEYQYKFVKKGPKDFGQREDLLCPYYDKEQNNCKIWQFRGVVCTTYFCTSSYGKIGKNYWSDFSDYLSFVEMSLAEDNLVELDFSPREISTQLVFLNMNEWSAAQKKQRSLDKSDYKKMWNGYESEVDFYKRCYELAKSRDRKYFLELLGAQGLKLEKKVISVGQQIGE